jgi:tetratricopeptide (TPR) repeat protein
VPKFAYKAIDSAGEESFGLIDADDEKDAIAEVGRKGLFPTEVRRANIGDELRLRWQDSKRQREEYLQKRQEQAKRRQTRQRLVVRYADGRTEYGVCFALNPKEGSFHLDLTDKDGVTTGKTKQIRYADLKAVFYVKSFDGKFDKGVRFHEWAAEGNELIVEFKDGEVIRGLSVHHYDPDEPRFYLVPKDPATNNISILIERAAVAHTYTPEEYEARRAEKLEARKATEAAAELTQEETLGDFYFETRNYAGALEQYTLAAKKFPQSGRIRRKMLAAQFNIGVQHIKRREYAQAMAAMQKVLHMDPRNAHAQKKVAQLQRILERGQRHGPEQKIEHEIE